MHITKKLFIFSVALCTLTACGNNPTDRALSGAGLGAGAGAITGAVVGGSAVTGAAIGAAAGAVTGAATDKDDINFGKPAWKR